jgi:hypothetical protein
MNESDGFPQQIGFEILKTARSSKMSICIIVLSKILAYIIARAFYDDKVLCHTFGQLFDKFINNCNKSDKFEDSLIKISLSMNDYLKDIDIPATLDFLSKPHFAKAIDIDLDKHRWLFFLKIMEGEFDLMDFSIFDYYNLFIDYYNYYQLMPSPDDSAIYLESLVDCHFIVSIIIFNSLTDYNLVQITDEFKRIIPSKIGTRAFHKTDLKKNYVLLIYRYYKFKPGSTFHAVISKIYEIFRDAVDSRNEIPNIGMIPYDTGVPSKDAIKRYLTEDGIRANDFKEIHKGKRKYLVLQGN